MRERERQRQRQRDRERERESEIRLKPLTQKWTRRAMLRNSQAHHNRGLRSTRPTGQAVPPLQLLLSWEVLVLRGCTCHRSFTSTTAVMRLQVARPSQSFACVCFPGDRTTVKQVSILRSFRGPLCFPIAHCPPAVPPSPTCGRLVLLCHCLFGYRWHVGIVIFRLSKQWSLKERVSMGRGWH